ncbi:MAG: hypothetical protein HQL06_15520 [Nitrospirae bacterium]|nr:hypothetical protein [Nitrospirota bacterium]
MEMSVRSDGADTGQMKAAGDHNGDGMNDMLWQDSSAGDLYIWFIDGTTIGSRGYADHAIPIS